MPSVGKDEVYVGLDCGRRAYVISSQMVQEYADAVQDHHPWYFSSSPFGAPVAPGLIRHSEMFVDRRWYLPNIYATPPPSRGGDCLRPSPAAGISSPHCWA